MKQHTEHTRVPDGTAAVSLTAAAGEETEEEAADGDAAATLDGAAAAGECSVSGIGMLVGIAHGNAARNGAAATTEAAAATGMVNEERRGVGEGVDEVAGVGCG